MRAYKYIYIYIFVLSCQTKAREDESRMISYIHGRGLYKPISMQIKQY